MMIRYIIFAVLLIIAMLGGAAGQTSRYEELPGLDTKTMVRDSLSGLYWITERGRDLTWSEALSYCQSLVYANHDDWRLPDVNELRALMVYGVYDTATEFPEEHGGSFWTATSYAGNPTYAWFVCFNNGSVYAKKKNSRLAARCVRR